MQFDNSLRLNEGEYFKDAHTKDLIDHLLEL